MARRVNTIGQVRTLLNMLLQSGTLLTRRFNASFNDFQNLKLTGDTCEVAFVQNPSLEYVTHFVTRLLALGRLQRIVLPAPTQKYAVFYQPALNYCACALGRCYSSTQIAVTTSKPIFGYLLDTYHDGKLQLRD